MSGRTTSGSWPIPLDDPYPAYADLRASGPVHWLDELGCHLVVGYAEARDILRSSRWSSDARANLALAARLGLRSDSRELLAPALLFTDPPQHTRLRRAISSHLSPKAIEALRPRIQAIVSAALDGWPPGHDLDVMPELAYPVPLAVICEMLDTGTQLAAALRLQTPRLVGLIDPLASQETIEAAMSAAIALMLDLVPIVAGRLARPAADLLSCLVSRSAEAPGLEGDEAIVMALLLLAAGHETTASLIGNAVITLHAQPGQARLLRERPELIPAAVEELIRFESPVQLIARTARQDVEVGPVTVAAGEQVLICAGAANRDPSVFAEPDHLDFHRDSCPHLGLGHGLHFCAGAALARVEAQEILRQLLALRPPLEERRMSFVRGTSRALRQVMTLTL
jgi:cytochrome P450